MIGTITITLANITNQDLMRYREIMDILVDSGALQEKNADVILHFGAEKELISLELSNKYLFKRGRDLPKLKENAKITLIP